MAREQESVAHIDPRRDEDIARSETVQESKIDTFSYLFNLQIGGRRITTLQSSDYRTPEGASETVTIERETAIKEGIVVPSRVGIFFESRGKKSPRYTFKPDGLVGVSVHDARISPTQPGIERPYDLHAALRVLPEIEQESIMLKLNNDVARQVQRLTGVPIPSNA